jgi:hypothetical protein
MKYQYNGYSYIMKIIADYIYSQEIDKETKINFGILPMKYNSYKTTIFSDIIGVVGPFFIIVAYASNLGIYVYRMVLEKENKVKEVKERVRKSKPKRYCVCGKELTSKQGKFCSQECAHNAISKRPLVLDLMDKIKEFDNNMSAIGRYYGVSDQAVRKWCKLYKLI